MERLLELASDLEEEGDAVTEARRELHTLKGSCRMLNVSQLAELCHDGETALQTPSPSTPATTSACASMAARRSVRMRARSSSG